MTSFEFTRTVNPLGIYVTSINAYNHKHQNYISRFCSGKVVSQGGSGRIWYGMGSSCQGCTGSKSIAQIQVSYEELWSQNIEILWLLVCLHLTPLHVQKTGVSGNSRSRPFPRMKASDSHSRIREAIPREKCSFFLTLFKQGGGHFHVQKLCCKFCIIQRALWQHKLRHRRNV